MTKPFLYAVEREYDTTIQQLWDAWADPAALSVWYSPTDLSVLPGSVQNVAEVGGIWTVGVDVPAYNFVAYFYGLYTEVQPLVRMVHTMHYTQSAEEFAARVQSELAHIVQLDFEDRGGKAWVKFTQFGELPGGDVERTKAGMESYFDNLGKFLSA